MYFKKSLYNYVKFKLTLIFFVCLISFSVSCSQQDSATPPNSQSSTVHIRSVWAKDFAAGQLEAHYLKHKNEFAGITQEEYLNNARDLLNSYPSKDILEKIRANGDILHYIVSTGEFAVMAKDGHIRTYFKTNYRYWLRQ